MRKGSAKGAGVVTVFCAEDHPDIALMLRMAIDHEPGMAWVGCAEDAGSMLAAIRGMRPTPRVAVVDLTMPGSSVQPLEAIRALAAECPACRVIVYTAHEGRQVADQAMDAGAWGCVGKHQDLERLLEAIRRVSAGEAVFG